MVDQTRRSACSCARILALTGLFTAGLLPGAPSNADPPQYRDGIILLAFRDSVPTSQQSAFLGLFGGTLLKRIGVGTHVIRVPNGLVAPLVQFLKTRPEIRYAEPDYIHKVAGGSAPGTIPNDPSVALQWAVQNTGQTVNGTPGTPGADERSPLAWGLTTGTNSVVVAVLDTGVQYSHPDLLTNMWNNPGSIGGCPAGTHGYNVLASNCDPMDDDNAYGGHGSHVAGILGAAGNNAAGVTGVNWSTSIMAVKWVDSNGNGATSDLITAIDWVITCKQAGVNVRVVNDSATWPGTGFSQALSDAIDLLGSNDVLFVTAAGNTAQNNDTLPRYPCSYARPTEVCVAASDQNDNLWSSSNYGLTTVQLAAPGVNIYSTKRLSNYGYISGGSMASPQVAGTAALILSTGYKSVADLRTAILNGVDKLSSLTPYVATGGRLNVCKAVPGCTSATTGSPVNTSAPAILGIPQAGSVVAASTGTWSGLPTTYSYQWSRCNNLGANCTGIPGATGQSYALMSAADAGSTFVVQVTGANIAGSTAVISAPTTPAAAASSPFSLGSTIADGQSIANSVVWQANPAQSVSFVQFYIDGVLSQTISSPPYTYNQSGSGKLDTTSLSNGTHVLGLRALAGDNRTWAFYGATITVSNSSIRLIQSKAAQASGVGSISVAFASANTAGNLVIACVRMSTASQTVNVSDSNGNVYTDAVSQTQTSDGHQIHIFYARNVKGGANTLKATFSGINNHPWLAVYEYAGLNQTAPLDQTAAAQGWGATVNIGPAATTTNATELVFAAAGFPSNYGGTVTATGAYSLQQQDTQTSRAASETLVTSAAGAYSAGFALSSNAQWSGVMATFLPAGAVAQPPSISTTTLPAGTQNVSYSATLAASGGTPPYTWSINSGNLPAGLTLAGGTGVISGMPTTAGTSNFTVLVTDHNSLTASRPLSITISPGVSNPVTLVQSGAAERSAVTSVSVNFPSVNNAGNLIIAAVRMSTASQTVSVTDTAGNVYTDAVSQVQSSDGHQIHLFYARNIKAGVNTVTATFSGANNHPWLAAYEYSGLNAANPLDQTAGGQGSNSNPTTAGTAPTSSANELVFAVMGMPASFSGTVTSGNGFTMLQQDVGTSRSANEAELVTTTGSYAGSFNLSSSANWSAIVATFRQ